MTVRFIKDYEQYKTGQVVKLSQAKALWYIKLNVAIKDKMMDTYKHG